MAMPKPGAYATHTAVQQWRKLQFFDKEVAKEGSETGLGSVDAALVTTDATGTDEYIVVSDLEGAIRFFDRDVKLVRSFHAYLVSCQFVAFVSIKKVLVTLGIDQNGAEPSLKYWDLKKWDHMGIPDLMHEIVLPSLVPATVLSVSRDLSQVAVGLCDGCIHVFAGDLAVEIVRREVKMKGGNPVTALAYADHGGPVLYASTAASVRSYKAPGGDLTLLSELERRKGVEVGCAAVVDDSFVLARKDGLYVYSPTSLSSFIATASEKLHVFAFKRYVAVVEAPEVTTGRSNVAIYHLALSFVAYQGSFAQFTHFAFVSNVLFALTKQGNVYYLNEKGDQKKLDVLFRRNLFEIAIEIANDGSKSAQTAEIYRLYGDSLYGKGAYDAAMNQYMQTIGHASVEPSYIIKKFLETQHNKNLTRYLEGLHQAGVANPNHTTLLLNCYTKLKDYDKLRSFIRQPNLVFDVGAAISVCRSAGYYEYALDLAQGRQAHAWYARLLIDDFHRHEDALTYLRKLSPKEAAEGILKVGSDLLTHLPFETNQYLMALVEEGDAVSPEELMSLYVTQPRVLTQFLEFVIARRPKCSTKIYNKLLELYLRDYTGENEAQKTERHDKAKKLLSEPELSVDINHALVLAQTYEFKEGLLLLFERLNMGSEVCQQCMEDRDYASLLRACKKYGKREPRVWTHALIFLVSEPLGSCDEYISRTLQYIRQKSLLSPTQILDIFTQSGVDHPLGTIREYLSTVLSDTQRRIEDDATAAISHLQGSARAQREIERLQTEAIEISADSTLELPTVHFLSGHSYSFKELPNERYCPATTPEYESLLSRQRQLQASAQNHSEFFRQLDGADSGFNVISTFLGRGLFDKQEGSAKNLELPTLEPDLFADLGLKAI